MLPIKEHENLKLKSEMNIKFKTSSSILFLVVLLLGACATKKGLDSSTKSAASAEMQEATADADGWISLFDGKTTKGWRNYKKQSVGKSWVVKEGTLNLEVVADGKGRTKAKDGGDLMTLKQYENFELSLEWNISDCGNSGILFCVVEGPEYDRVYHTGPEMQVLDNTCHPDAKIHTHRAGDLYDMIPCSKEVVKPAGEWNLSEIKVVDGKTEFRLNGQKVVEFTMFDDQWFEMIAESKFKDMPGFGKFRKGHIVLQDHGDAVSYRNIKIREL